MSELSAAILRSPHDKLHPYVMINRELAQDTSISFKCKGFLIYCLSLPDNWNFCVSYFCNKFEMGKNAIYGIINEAIGAGYIEKEIYFEGNLKRTRYLVSEFKKCFPRPDFRDAEKQGSRESDSTKYISSSLHSEEKKIDRGEEKPADAAPPDDFFSYGRIKMKRKDYEKLKSDHPNMNVDLEIERANNWLLAEGTTKSNYAAFMRNWMIKAKEISSKNPYAAFAENIRINKEYAEWLKKTYPTNTKELKLEFKYASIPSMGKEYPYTLPTEDFKRGIVISLGGEL